jgi:hypothetical protein
VRTYITDLFLVGEKSAIKGTKGVEVIEAGDELASTLNSEDRKDKTKEKEKVLEHLADAEKVIIFCLVSKDCLMSHARRLQKCQAKT